jgi:hypothetical protein
VGKLNFLPNPNNTIIRFCPEKFTLLYIVADLAGIGDIQLSVISYQLSVRKGLGVRGWGDGGIERWGDIEKSCLLSPASYLLPPDS